MSQEPIKHIGGGPVGWFAQNHVAANILMMLFIIGGIISVASMRTETFPEIDPKMITIRVAYPGATPYEIADSITNRVEQQLVGIDGIKRIVSSATEGAGVVRVQLEDFANADDVYNEVETEVNSISEFPPEDAERVVIKKVRPVPKVMTLAIHGDVSEDTLKYWGETIEEELQHLDGVARTNLTGIRQYQISVEIPEAKLRQYGLTLEQVQNIIQQFSRDIPAGTVESERGDILLRVQERRRVGHEFDKIIVTTLPDGSSLSLGDIATIKDEFEDVNLISRFNGERAAFINIRRSNTDDTIMVAESIKAYLENVKLPEGVNITLQDDQTISLHERISLMLQNAVLGFMLVFLILLLFLDLKLAFWTSAAIPISFLGGLMVIHMLGYSINMVSLFALIVVLGVVVDDAIVTGESIFETQENEPKNPAAVMHGVMLVIAPVTVGILTTVFAFAPLIFSTGHLGQIIAVIPAVVISILFVSLIEAYLILPSHLSSPKRWSKGILKQVRNRFSEGLARGVDRFVIPAASFCISWRYATLAAFIAILLITHAMVASGFIRFIFFPRIEGDEITITMQMPLGTPFELTRSNMEIIERETQRITKSLEQDGKSIVESMIVTIGQLSGSNNPTSDAQASSAGNLAQLKLKLVSSDERDHSSSDVESMIRAKVSSLPGIEKLEFQSSLIGEEADIEVELSHTDEEILFQAAEFLKKRLDAIEGTNEVADTYEPGKTEYVFELTEEGLAVGLTPVQLGQQLRAAYFGLEAQRFQRGESEVIVYVRYPKSEREDITTLNQTRIRLADGSEVPLASVARIKTQTGYSQIESVNGRRIVSVTGDVDYGITTPNEVLALMEAEVFPALEERYPGISYTFEGETREQKEDMQSLMRNMQIALLLIYVLLGAQLRSYVQPILIMTAIPFGVVGAVWGHFLLGYDLTFISMFGIVALTGVVVNDSVVLVDYLNRQIREGNSVQNSAVTAIRRRFRPILLTTLTTSLGLLPIILETSLQAQFLIPMVVSLAMGILFSTTVILLLIPCLVVISSDIEQLFLRHKESRQRQP